MQNRSIRHTEAAQQIGSHVNIIRSQYQDIQESISQVIVKNPLLYKVLSSIRDKISILIDKQDALYDELSQKMEKQRRKYHKSRKKYKQQILTAKEAELNTRKKLEAKKQRWNQKKQNFQKEIEIIKSHIQEGQKAWQEQMHMIESSVQDQELQKQKIQAKYYDRMHELDGDIDEIMHILSPAKNLNQPQLLPQLFSMDELFEEQQIVLGEVSQRKNIDGKISKLEEEDKFDIQNESEDLSQSIPSKLDTSRRDLYFKLMEIRRKLKVFRNQDLSQDTQRSSQLSQLSLNLKSLSGSEILNTDDLSHQISRSREDVNIEDLINITEQGTIDNFSSIEFSSQKASNFKIPKLKLHLIPYEVQQTQLSDPQLSSIGEFNQSNNSFDELFGEKEDALPNTSSFQKVPNYDSEQSVSVFYNSFFEPAPSILKTGSSKVILQPEQPKRIKEVDMSLPVNLQNDSLQFQPQRPKHQAPLQIRNPRGRSIQPNKKQDPAPPNITRSESPPNIAVRFRIRRYKEPQKLALRNNPALRIS